MECKTKKYKAIRLYLTKITPEGSLNRQIGRSDEDNQVNYPGSKPNWGEWGRDRKQRGQDKTQTKLKKLILMTRKEASGS